VVGIVLVSHSHSVAEGAAELARQMGGDEVRIETAGGLDDPARSTGTDAVLVMKAIERAWSDDGVLVLMDLGSAVLSAEMALDLLPEDRRDKVRLSDAPFVEGAVSAAVSARLGSKLDEVAAEALGGLAGKAAHLGTESPSGIPVAEGAGAEPPEVSVRLTVRNPHGLHARPAARLVQTASSFEATVSVANLTAGRGPASARSLNAVATLGVVRGNEIEVSASGPQAGEAVDAIRALAGRGFDEEVDGTEAEPEPGRPVVTPDEGLRGLPASPGIAVGPLRRFHVPALEIPERPPRDPAEEQRRLDAAITAARRDVESQRASVSGRAGPYQAAIFDAHLLFLEDPVLLAPVRTAIREGSAAELAWRDAVEEMARAWGRLDDEYQRARAADLRSVGEQVLARLLGIDPPKPVLEAPGVLVTADLTPADAAALDPAVTLGVLTAFGGPTSHAAVLARSIGIPAVVGAGEAILDLAEGTMLALDGESGLVRVDPSGVELEAFEARARRRREAERAARATARTPAATRDGVLIKVAANVGSPVEIPAAVEAGCDGVGLFRSEFLFMERDAMPDEDEQEAAYRASAESLGGRPLIVRTLDAGADKPLPYLAQPPEANPFLGVRGFRLSLARPELLDAQLRAVLRVAADHPVGVMFPMIANLEELRAGRAAVRRARDALAAEGRRVPERLTIGVMVEVPSAALVAEHLAAEVDFFSIGTNDLTQYTLAAERGNERVAPLADALDPSVLELIRRTASAGAARGLWTSVCGELAADPLAASLLIGLGVRELSMSPPAIPRVKAVVRETDLVHAEDLARKALSLPSAGAVRELLRQVGEDPTATMRPNS
jgi:multiphosphoryl transfer protein